MDVKVFTGIDLAGPTQETVEPGWEWVFYVTFSKGDVPDPLIDRHAKGVRLWLANGDAEGIVTAADDNWMVRVDIFGEVVFIDQTVAAKVWTDTKDAQEEF